MLIMMLIQPVSIQFKVVGATPVAAAPHPKPVPATPKPTAADNPFTPPAPKAAAQTPYRQQLTRELEGGHGLVFL